MPLIKLEPVTAEAFAPFGQLLPAREAGEGRLELIEELQEILGGVKADDKTRAEIAELADTLRDNLDKIVQHGKRADSIVKNMLLHSREGPVNVALSGSTRW